MKILIVKDKIELLKAVSNYLSKEKYICKFIERI